MTLREQVNVFVVHYLDEVISWRRHLHQYPELSFEEKETAAFITQRLKEMDIPFKEGIAGTGIVGRIEGKNPESKVIALRADMDALPVQEATKLSFQSQNQGKMHACGHDAHMASLLGAARILTRMKDQFEGTILLIFQPGEELIPGGAKLMLEEGVLETPKPEIILGQHVLPTMDTGKVGFRSGMYMASGDEIHFKVKGTGGHGAMPHLLTDPVIASAHVLVALQQIVSRFAPANIPTVLSFGRVVANGATNVIPTEVEVSGTMRTMNEEWRARAKELIQQIAQNTAASFGCEVEFDIRDGYPMVYNNEEVTEQARTFAQEFLGEENVEEMDIRMTAEDFGYFTKEFPCTFYRFGVRGHENKESGGLHTPTFFMDEESLRTGMGLMAYQALCFLQKK